jgi:hypothetical protein
VALTVFAGISGGQLRITDDTAADVVSLDHSGTSTFVGGTAFPDSQITNGILIQTGTGGPGTGLDTVNILATVKPVTVDGQFDTKTVNLGKAGSVQGIQAPVTIFDLADGNFDSLIVDDSADTFGRNVTMNASGSVATIDNLAQARITYTPPQDGKVTIRGGPGGNTFTVANIADVFLSNVTLKSGLGSDTVNVLALSDENTGLFIDGVAGRDHVNVGNAGSVQGIESFLDVRNTGGFTDLIVDDSADPTGRDVTMRAGGPGEDSSILGLTPNGILSEISYINGDLSLLQVNGGRGGNTFTINDTFKNSQFGLTVVNTGTGTDTVNIKATTGTLIVNGQSGQDAVNIGASAGNAFGTANIKGDVSITNVGSRSSLDVSDFSASVVFNGVGHSVVLDHASVPGGVNTGTISGLAPATISYVSNDVRSVTLTGSNFADSFFVRSTPGIFSTVTVNGGFGNDVINVGGVGNTLDGILGPVTVNGGFGTDTVNIRDNGSTTPHTYSQTATSLTRSGGGTPAVTINYPGIEFLGVAKGPVVNPHPPLAKNLALSQNVRVGGLARLTGRLDEADKAAQLSLTVVWGDGSPPLTIAPGRKPFNLKHAYAAAGTYVVRAIWSDASGESNSRDLPITVLAAKAPHPRRAGH